MVRDTEVQKRMFRRYMKQLEGEGRISKQVTWGEMRYGLFILPAWFYRFPDPVTRSDVYSFVELREIRENVKRNWKVIAWLAPAFLVLICIAFWPVMRRI
ncbi:MAG: hypothetical protein IPK70_10495 [Flavobacteriales bacterium]|jgi:hypothetical protein|nr:hypothetical protein [Flavobacteriales bacterium]